MSMPRAKKWPNRADTVRLETIAILLRIVEESDKAFEAIKAGKQEIAVRRLGQIRKRASKGAELLRDVPDLSEEESETLYAWDVDTQVRANLNEAE